MTYLIRRGDEVWEYTFTGNPPPLRFCGWWPDGRPVFEVAL